MIQLWNLTMKLLKVLIPRKKTSMRFLRIILR